MQSVEAIVEEDDFPLPFLPAEEPDGIGKIRIVNGFGGPETVEKNLISGQSGSELTDSAGNGIADVKDSRLFIVGGLLPSDIVPFVGFKLLAPVFFFISKSVQRLPLHSNP